MTTVNTSHRFPLNVLTCTHASGDKFASIQDSPMLNRDCAELQQKFTIERGNETIVAKAQF